MRGTELAERAARRRAALASRELRRGLAVLRASIPAVALAGVLTTLFCLNDSFVGGSTSKSALLAALTERIALAQTGTAAGLLMAILIDAVRRGLEAVVEQLEGEMSIAILDLRSTLERYAESCT